MESKTICNGGAHRLHVHPLRAWAQFNSVMKSPGAPEQLRLESNPIIEPLRPRSILLFEKALAIAPGEALTEYWLGRSYLKSGL